MVGFYKRLLWYAGVSLAGLIIFLGVFRYFDRDLSIPFNYTGDAVVHYNFAKNLEETGNWSVNPRFGQPLGQTLYDFPLSEGLMLLMIRILLFFGFNWLSSVNAFYVLTFPLTTLIAFYVFRKFKVTNILAASFALIYTFIPYHFYRGVDHLFLSGYFALPLSVLAGVKLARKESFTILELALYPLLLGSIGAYYTFFSVFILFSGFLVSFFKCKLSRKFLLQAGVLLLGAVLVFLLNLVPSLAYFSKYGRNFNAMMRNPKDTETYGLKLSQLILPVEDHNFSLFNKIRKQYRVYTLSGLLNENVFSSLGLVSSVGFLFLLGWFLFRPTLNLGKFSNEDLAILSIFTFLLILYCVVGGFGHLFSVFVFSSFRALNRVSIIFAFISLVALGLLLNDLFGKRPKLLSAVSLFLLAFALYDQICLGTMRNFLSDRQRFLSYVRFARQIEQTLSHEGRVYTIPYGQYPEGSDKSIMRIPLLTENIQWSTGSAKLRSSNYWQYKISLLSPEDFLIAITQEGFNGLVILNKKDLHSAIVNISDLLGQEPLVTPDGDFYFFDLRVFVPQERDKSEIPYYHISGDCVTVHNESTVPPVDYWCTENAYLVLEKGFPEKWQGKAEITYHTGSNTFQKTSFPISMKDNFLKINLGSYISSSGVFPKPHDKTNWPPNLGYPKFIITNINVVE